ncbi:proline racemase family protein [Pseudovibrio sp. JE062]|uniref:proline racemase family protein n=1 Tax=Pseudovibrio sp. JE062 TaxID=439495 RepID=UPI000568143B|nr:proline racemase family protein [Pseudovibrio sp. JE062]
MKLNNMITVVGAHAEGEVGRVITGGLLPPPGATMLDKLINMENDMDWVRQMLLSDPRGSVNTSVNYITPPCHRDADFGMIVMESDYYVHMSGSNLICTVTAALETGMVPMTEPFTKVVVDTPAGLVHVTAECVDGKCRRISFDNIPSFVMHRDRIIDVPGFGSKRVDVSYGGMIYVIAEASEFGFSLDPSESRDLVEIGEILKKAAAEQLPSVHPEIPEIHTVNQTQFTGPLETKDGVKTSKNAVIVSPGRLDRCPCGTGSSARLALLHARGEIEVGEKFVHRSILDTEFECQILGTTQVGQLDAVKPQIKGRAWLTGISQYGVDPEDPFPTGYRLADTWFK